MYIRKFSFKKLAIKPKPTSLASVLPVAPKKSKSKIKLSAVFSYVGLFVLIIASVFVGYAQPKPANTNFVADTSLNVSDVKSISVNDIVANNVAASVGQIADLPVATSVANMAVSAQTKSEYLQTDSTTITKPQLVDTNTLNRSVTIYKVVSGDNVESLAGKFGISKDTIKWANNLTSDALVVGSEVKILPVNGVLYTVKIGDSIDSIANKYKVDKTRLVLFNDLDVSGISTGQSLILPDGILPNNERPGYVAPVTYYAGTASGFGGRTWFISYGTPDGPYTHGNCTLYAYNRRNQLGLGVGSNWGNASSWAANARANGYMVNSTPGVGAIIQNGGYLGHVGIVEELLPNGDISISEMNAYVSGGGYNIVSGRIVPAASVGNYLYIH